MCGYELSTNLQKITQKDLTKMKIFLNVLGGGATFLKHPVYLALMPAVNAATGQVLWTTATVPQVECDTSLVVSGGVDCGRRRRNVYDKKPQRYAIDNRRAHLTARSDL